MRYSTAALLGLFVVMAVVGSAALIQDPNDIQIGYHPTSLSTTTSSTNPSTNLELKLSLNATSIPIADSVNVSLSEYNTLGALNNVTVANNWPIRGLNDGGGCGILNLPIGFAVFQGYYTGYNISSASSLELASPGLRSCPGIFSEIYSYAFHPHNSTADIYASCSPDLCRTEGITSGLAVRGDWSNGLLGASFNVLSPGVYTVVAGDERGTAAYLYFVVE
jgi:hypothetical protein